MFVVYRFARPTLEGSKLALQEDFKRKCQQQWKLQMAALSAVDSAASMKKVFLLFRYEVLVVDSQRTRSCSIYMIMILVVIVTAI